MRSYESIIVFAPDQSDAQIKQEVKRYEGILEGKGATNVVIDNWGRRDLAYVVKKHKHGKFVSIKFETADHSAVDGLTSLLRISDPVIKFQSHRTNEKVRKFRGNPKRKNFGDGQFGYDEEDSLDY